jgi:hypothetical protein
MLMQSSLDNPPRIPGDLEDRERAEKTDDRVADFQAEANERRASNDAEGDEPTDTGVLAVCDERRTGGRTSRR